MTEIITITLNPALDLATDTPAVIPDVKLRCTAPLVHPGGGGVNVSRAIAQLGGASRTLIAYGGSTGDMLCDLLREEGLTPESLGVTYPTRQSVSVRDEATGLQYRFMMPGPRWNEIDCATARETILSRTEPGALLIPSGSLPPGVDAAFFLDLLPEIADRGGRMMLDTSGEALKLAADRPCGLFALRMDREEARSLSGQPLTTLEDIAAFASELHKRGCAGIVMIAAGSQGTVIATEAWRGVTRPPMVVPLSKVGAGDSFVAGFALGITRGDTAVDACALGTAAASSAVTTPGTALCNRDDTMRYLSAVTKLEL